jgi:thiol-disulfide isomerase/thioredoxin
MPSQKTKSVLADILSGAASAAMALTLTAYTELPYVFLFVSIASLITGFIRGKQRLYDWVSQAALINCLYYIFFLSLLSGMIQYAVIPIISLIGTSIGLYIRFCKKRLLPKPVITLFAYVLSTMLGTFVALPAYLHSMNWSAPRIKYSHFKLLDSRNDTIYSQSLNNKVIVLDFWATWCRPCVKSFPVMQEVYNKFRSDDRVKFLIINTGMKDTKQKAMDFISKHNYDLPFAFDINKQTSKSYGVIRIPQVIIIDKKGVPRLIHHGYDESSQFKEDFIARLDSLIIER